MSKRATVTKSAISPVQAATSTARKKPRLAKPAAAPPPINADYWQGYDEWQPVKAHPAKRRAYIKKLCQRIAEAFQPEKIILFGSQAYGKPTPDSDVDLLVVMRFEGGYFEQSHQIRMRLGLSLPVDLLVRTPEELEVFSKLQRTPRFRDYRNRETQHRVVTQSFEKTSYSIGWRLATVLCRRSSNAER